MALPNPRAEGFCALKLSFILLTGLTLFLTLAAHSRRSSSRNRADPGEYRDREMQDQIRAVRQRVIGKGEYAKALSGGRMTLLEASAACLALSREPPAFDWDGFRKEHPGAS